MGHICVPGPNAWLTHKKKCIRFVFVSFALAYVLFALLMRSVCVGIRRYASVYVALRSSQRKLYQNDKTLPTHRWLERIKCNKPCALYAFCISYIFVRNTLYVSYASVDVRCTCVTCVTTRLE